MSEPLQTLVCHMTSEQLAKHMRRLQTMQGWHDPLADRLFKEIEALREQNAALNAALRSVHAVAIECGEKYGACDQVDNDGHLYQSQWLADLLAAPHQVNQEKT